MKMRMIRFIFAIAVVAMMFVNMLNVIPTQAKTEISSEDLSKQYLNASVKFIYLGNVNKHSFNFNIKEEAQEKGAKYIWFIKTDKGNPNAITLDCKTGVVNAKEAGTAYIYCKVIHSDGLVIRPEAMVTVRNNITEVGIANLPEDMTLKAATSYDFNETILNTKGGINAVTQGITRWELKEDTADVQTISDSGLIYPLQEGEFQLRAVCFQSTMKYKLWLSDKYFYQDFIMAATKWYVITVISSDGTAVVINQDQLNRVLLSDQITLITLVADSLVNYSIPAGDYRDKVLIVDRLTTKIDNHGFFKEVRSP